jgi:hypothetical protein
MARYKAIIETRRGSSGRVRAGVADGPDWARGWTLDGKTKESAADVYAVLRDELRAAAERSFSLDTLDFLHANL